MEFLLTDVLRVIGMAELHQPVALIVTIDCLGTGTTRVSTFHIEHIGMLVGLFGQNVKGFLPSMMACDYILVTLTVFP